MRDTAYIALGSNLGDRDAHLRVARERIAGIARTRVLAASAVEETAPIGPAGQGAYLNQMLAIETELAPAALLAALQEIERAAGRERAVRWGARTLDLDIVLFGAQRVNEPALVVPHPALAHRDFWRRQLGELGVAA
jgi:2-amino-4-hydroxy-6-hydroxymethyldihydropteridine diphosphokinase